MLILPGAPEKDILETAAWAAGRAERVTGSTDAAGGASLSHEAGDMIHAAELLPQAK